MLCLEVPNIIWAKNQPDGYDPSNEPRPLRVLERIGQVLCTATILLFRNTTPTALTPWIGWFFAAIALMFVYELFWVRYFRGQRTLDDFYRPLLGIPVPGALLPVIAFLVLGVYGRLLPLIIASIILGIGHVGIHLLHAKELRKEKALAS